MVQTGPNAATESIGGSAFAAIPELSALAIYAGCWRLGCLLSYAATIIYFEQAHIVSEAVKSAGPQTRIFASIDLAVSVLTLADAIARSPAGCSSVSAPVWRRLRCRLSIL